MGFESSPPGAASPGANRPAELVDDSHAYYFDLRAKATASGPTPADASGLLQHVTSTPQRANPVDVVQIGLGALQQEAAEWLPVVEEVVAWIERTMDERGLLLYGFPMRHTYRLAAPWCSSLAQGEAASLLVRAAEVLGRPDLRELAGRAIASLLDPESELVALTPEGPVLQEYPTRPPAHVLNGWVTSLWGLYDVAGSPGPWSAATVAASAAEAFEAGVATLAARVGRYRTPVGWSRYDLYPHPLANVASPSYHRLHIGHLRTMNELAPRDVFVEVADEWERAAASTAARSFAVARKVAFRLSRPRWAPAAALRRRPPTDA
jgi:heparosan-N-sulfate-glucuronate 5-epimerase